MSEYNIGFSQKLIEAASGIEDELLLLYSENAARAVLYLALLSCEITLKAVLEHAGKPVDVLKNCRHDLKGLLNHLRTCQIEVEIGCIKKWVPATRILVDHVDSAYGNANIGTLLEAEEIGASKYPNQIRYGNQITHYPPEMMLDTARKLLVKVKEHWDHIRVAK